MPVAIRVPGLGRSVYQTSYTAMCELLRRVLGDTVESAPGTTGGIGSVACRATAGLYALLIDYPIDQRGRCQSCRRPKQPQHSGGSLLLTGGVTWPS